MKYLNNIPAKYTTLAAQSIVAASNAAAAIAMPPNADQTETLEPRQLKKLPRKKNQRRLIYQRKKNKVAALLTNSDDDEPAWSLSVVENEEL
jgi:hypothetical protein